MFNRLEKDLRRIGKVGLADKIKEIHRLNGADIPFPEIKSTLVSQFSKEQRLMLEQKGYVIYRLTGQTIESLRNNGHSFRSRWHIGEAIEQVRSILSDVAINPTNPFLQDCLYKTLYEQQYAVENFGRKLSSEIRGVTAILGSVSDYVELEILHFAATGKRLFSGNGLFAFTRTTSPAGVLHGALVGYNKNSLDIFYWGREVPVDLIGAIPLIIPTTVVNH